ncbi:MAG: hypothetical protein ISR88_07440 [Candidatus Marinimicrobia bacterium]|nr:hypothetical protein [FCB group bacterium]MBL7028243.1 hypothetical protein [Candidatus Neomarinimicrobiota bacterium]
MTEMLANYYLMNHKFEAAVAELEAALINCPNSLSIKRKLMLGYVITDRSDEALPLLSSMVEDDLPSLVGNFDSDEVCPFPILYEIITGSHKSARSAENLTKSLGIIWLFQDVPKSLIYLEQAYANDTKNTSLLKVIKMVEGYIKESPSSVSESPYT